MYKRQIYYSVSVADYEIAVTFNVGDTIKLKVPEADSDIMAASEVGRVS